MKNTETRWFNYGAAMAGAPFSCANGQRATVLQWEHVEGAPYTEYILVGVCGDANEPCSWTRWGRHSSGLHRAGEYSPFDLVMMPLAYIDGKAVFDGDVIVDTRGAPARAHARLTLPGSWKWPAPAEAPPAAEGDRAARDMAVAVAVAYALRAASDSQPAAVWQAVTREHLASIIARVPS